MTKFNCEKYFLELTSDMKALKEQGLAKVHIEKFRSSMVDLILGSLVKAVLK